MPTIDSCGVELRKLVLIVRNPLYGDGNARPPQRQYLPYLINNTRWSLTTRALVFFTGWKPYLWIIDRISHCCMYCSRHELWYFTTRHNYPGKLTEISSISAPVPIVQIHVCRPSRPPVEAFVLCLSLHMYLSLIFCVFCLAKHVLDNLRERFWVTANENIVL